MRGRARRAPLVAALEWGTPLRPTVRSVASIASPEMYVEEWPGTHVQPYSDGRYNLVRGPLGLSRVRLECGQQHETDRCHDPT